MVPHPLVITPISGLPMIAAGDDLASLLYEACLRSEIEFLAGDIVIVAQKIVSKSEDRFCNLNDVQVSPQASELASQAEKDPRLVELILQESRAVLRTRPGLIIVEHRLGFVCANAGIDHSNVQGKWGRAEDWVLLLPTDPDGSADRLRHALELRTGVPLGVLIIDSHGRAWREGITGVTIGLSGVPGVVDQRGLPDLLGYELRVTQIGAADELAAAASLVMGQAAEGIPAVHARGFPYPLREAVLSELLRPRSLDLFR